MSRIFKRMACAPAALRVGSVAKERSTGLAAFGLRSWARLRRSSTNLLPSIRDAWPSWPALTPAPPQRVPAPEELPDFVRKSWP